MFSAGASTVSFPYRCPVRSSFFRLWPPALSPASFVWPGKLLCAMASLPPRSASASIFAKMCTFLQDICLHHFIKSIAQKFLNFNTSRGKFSAESTLRKCTHFHTMSACIFQSSSINLRCTKQRIKKTRFTELLSEWSWTLHSERST